MFLCLKQHYRELQSDVVERFWGELVQDSKSAAEFLAYFWFKNHHMLKAKVGIKPNKNASYQPQVSLRSCNIKKLWKDHISGIKFFLCFLFFLYFLIYLFFFKFSSSLQFIKASSSQAGFDFHCTATNLGPNSRSLWQCPEQLSKDWLMRIGAGLSPCTVCHLAEDRHQHTELPCASLCAGHSAGCDVFLLLAAENEGPKFGSSDKKTEQSCFSSG